MVKWSFSSLKQYLNCPRQYQEVKLLKKFETKITSQITYGKNVHKVLEEYVRDGKPIPDEFRRMKRFVDVLLNIKGDRYVEHEMALRIDYTPCPFNAPDYWVRGITDLLIVDGDTAFVVDYKTGSNKYPDPKQLKLMALLIFNHFPDVKYVKGNLLFLVYGTFMSEDYDRKNMDKYWYEFKRDLARLELAVETNVFPPNPTPLCGWCPVTTCQFNRE